MRNGRVFRPVLNNLEQRIVLDHGLSASAAAIRAASSVAVKAHSPKLRIAARPGSAANVAGRIQNDFDQFSADLAQSRNQFISSYLPVSSAATTTTAEAQADAMAKDAQATAAKTVADTKAMASVQAQNTLIQANSDAAKAKALSDQAAKIASDAAAASTAMPNDLTLKSAASAALLDAANKKADSDAKAATAALDASLATTAAQEASDAAAFAKTLRDAATAAANVATIDAQADLSATANVQTQSTFASYITQRVEQLSQQVAGDLLLLVAAQGNKHKGHHPALIPNGLPAYLSTRLTNAGTAATNSSLLRQLTLGLPGPRATPATIQQLPASQIAATEAARNAIFNGSLLIKFNRTGRAPGH